MRTTIVYAVLTLLFAGCGDSSSEDILPPACRNFQTAVEDESVNIGRHFEVAMESLRGITNYDQRAACYARWIEKLCELDVGNLDYKRQAYCIREVLDASRRGEGLMDEYHLPDSWVELTIDSMLKGLTWGQRQLDRLKPTMPTCGSYDYGHPREYSEWKYCYISAWGAYHNALQMIEGVFFDSMCRGRAVSTAARENAQKKIEKFLGRKMRSEEERERAETAARAEIEAVHANKVGPDLKKLRPAVESRQGDAARR